MKIIKGIKKGIKLKVGRHKTLIIHKLKKYPARKCKKMFTPKSFALNIVDTVDIEAQNVPSEKNIPPDENVNSFAERTSTQLNAEQKKKQLFNKETADESSDVECDVTMWSDSEQQTQEETDNDWKLDVSNEKLEKEVNDDWMQIVRNEQRNLDSPIVVKMNLDNSIPSNIPEILEQQPKTRTESSAFYDKNIFIHSESWSNKDNHMVIIDSDCLKPKDDTHLPVEEKQALSVSWNVDETDQIKGNFAVNDFVRADVSPARRESVDQSISSNSDAEACCSSQKVLEDASEAVTTCNSRSEDVSDVSSFGNSPMHGESFLRRKFRKSNSPQAFTEGNDVYSHKLTKPQLYSIRNIVIVVMKSDSGFCFSGKLSMNVLYGAVEVYGAILDASKPATEVYSPKGYSSVFVESSEHFPEGDVENIWTALSAEGVTRDSESKLQEVIDKVEPGTAVLVLRNLENNLTLFLQTYFPLKLFPNVKNPGYYSWMDHQRAEIVLQARLHDPTRKRLIVEPCIITDIVNRMLALWRANEWSCTLVAGGKSVGKSTSARFLINRLLHTCGKVVLVDVDPGQAECTPAGCISYSLIEQPLTGPNFTHLLTPAYQLFIDEINVAQCVTRYLEGVRMLVDRLKRCPVMSRLPVVVNTMGFTRHIGWDLAIVTVKLVRPSFILQILSRKGNNYADLLSADIVNKQERKWEFCNETFVDWNRPCDHNLCVIYSNAENKGTWRSNELNLEPYQQRELVMMSYLSRIIRDDYNDPFQHSVGLPFSINEAVPYKTFFSSLCIIPQRLFGVPASHALKVINGNIVALCGIDLTEEESSQEPNDASGPRVLTQRSPLCTCYGFGIIRGVDMEQQEVFINTPLPISMMQHVNCLAGCIPVPPVLLQLSPGTPYVGGNATLPTSREPRKGYFRMKYRKSLSNS
ncbi:PREDICTED: polynucleotide 5'-hydroxyl-kinase NOL9 isoform X2 [Dinoponera quadriceps]|uniref:Polynucleotide 5'-hydroxyl-kinase NOL9 n=1 Tax=Dinoponera quadriceps TaxID=609295 RepID=A0A6P3XKV1_DINQU|nr:PREDICTED: polynucleotide 5'-hydroxyl-kinase NOL9 isoform X2 [Dinoponera quadriceps]